MAGTSEGARKTAAKRAGLTLADYDQRIAAGLKRCFACGRWLDRHEFVRDATRGDGLAARCCACSYKREMLGPTIRERRRHAASGLAWCCDCGLWLALTEVSQGRCREHRRLEARTRYASDPNFRYRCMNKTAMRRRGVEAVPPDGTEVVRERSDGLCIYCGAPGKTFDHLVAVGRGGETTPGNIALACVRCNSRKKDKPLDEWLDIVEREHGLSECLAEALAFMECSLFG